MSEEQKANPAAGQVQASSGTTMGSATGPSNLLERIQAEIRAMRPEEVAEAVAKIKTTQERLAARRSEHGPSTPWSEMTDAQKERARAYSREYSSRPEVKEKQKAYAKEYASRPGVKEREKAKREEKKAKEKAIIEAAKKMGIMGEDFK